MPSKRQKGQAFERECCRRLSLWVTHGERDDLFWRTAMSGGRATIRQRLGFVNKSQVGDIGAIDALGEKLLLRHVIVECKFRKEVGMMLGFLQCRGPLWNWWNGEVKKAEVAGRQPMMIVLENRVPAIILTTQKAGRHLRFSGDPVVMTLWQWPLCPSVWLFGDIVPRLTSWPKQQSEPKSG